MTSITNNNIREDAVFKGKVKDVLLRNYGSGGLVNVLLDFNARDAAAVRAWSSSNSTSPTHTKQTPSCNSAAETSKPGLTYEQFIAFLSDYGVELTPFEQHYLCRAFDDNGNGVISAGTFTRHLTGLNERRLRAVKQAWAALQEEQRRNGGGEGVTREVLLHSFHSTQPQHHDRHNSGTALSATFSDSKRQQLKESYLASTTGCTASDDTSGGANGNTSHSQERDEVSYAEFVVFYAGISAQFGMDEDFVAHVLKSWAADSSQRPMLGETAREWGPDGDPLALDGPRLVQDVLNRDLGVSSMSYNFSHMQREHPYVEPLPPLNRPDIMTTTTQRTYARYDEAERTLANPLATRRGQAM